MVPENEPTQTPPDDLGLDDLNPKGHIAEATTFMVGNRPYTKAEIDTLLSDLEQAAAKESEFSGLLQNMLVFAQEAIKIVPGLL